jgi:Cellulose binding domain
MLKIGFLGRVPVLAALSGWFAASGACGGTSSTNLFDETTPPVGGAGSSSMSSGGCTRARDCAAEQQCVGGQCVDQCQSDKQCTGAGLLCDTAAGYCSPTGNGSGGAGAGGSKGGGGSFAAGGSGGSRDAGGTGGSGERGGSSGAGGSTREAGGGAALVVEYMCSAAAASNSSIGFGVRITNNSDGDVPLGGFSVRYYFTNEAEAAPIVEMDYGAVSLPSQGLSGHFASMCSAYGPKATASTVCEINLSDLAPMSPGGTLLLQLRIHTPQYQVLEQSNDYSFDPTKTAFAPWDRVTVYREGKLLSGIAP